MDVLTVDDVSAWLQIPRARVIAMARRGELPGIVVCGQLRFSAAELETWLKERPRPTPALRVGS